MHKYHRFVNAQGKALARAKIQRGPFRFWFPRVSDHTFDEEMERQLEEHRESVAQFQRDLLNGHHNCWHAAKWFKASLYRPWRHKCAQNLLPHLLDEDNDAVLEPPPKDADWTWF